MDLYQPIEPLSPRERFDGIKDLLSGLAIIAFICAFVVWLPILAGTP